MERRSLLKYFSIPVMLQATNASSQSEKIPSNISDLDNMVDAAEAIWQTWLPSVDGNSLAIKMHVEYNVNKKYRKALIVNKGKKLKGDLQILFNRDDINSMILQIGIAPINSNHDDLANRIISGLPRIIEENISDDPFNAASNPYFIRISTYLADGKLKNFTINKEMKGISSEIKNWIEDVNKFCILDK